MSLLIDLKRFQKIHNKHVEVKEINNTEKHSIRKESMKHKQNTFILKPLYTFF